MCPACVAGLAMILGTVVTTGGVAAALAKVVRSKKAKAAEQNKLKENRS